MAEPYGGVVQYVIHPALRPSLDAWLIARGLQPVRAPVELEGEDELPTFFVHPTEETMKRTMRERGYPT